MSNDVVRQGGALATLDEMERMANAIAKSGLFGIKEPLQALALMLIAQSENQHPATIAQEYDIIQGRAARKTHSVLSRFQQAGGKVKWLELTDTCAKATFSHPDGGELTLDWTIERAKKTQVWNGKKQAFETLAERGMYQNYPRAMLRARCIAEGIRAVFPGAIGGMLVVEEAQDAEEKDMGPAVVVEQPKAKQKAASPPIAATSVVAPGNPSSVPEAVDAAPQRATAAVSGPEGNDVHLSQPTDGSVSASPSPQSVAHHTLSELLGMMDRESSDGTLVANSAVIRGYASDLSAEERATFESTLQALLADAAPVETPPPVKPMMEGQLRILRARAKSKGKTLEDVEKQFGKLDKLGFDQFNEIQSWITA